MRTTPLNDLDQHFLPWDEIEPLCILCELRVQGRLSPERLVAAVRTAVSHHPMARSRLTPIGRLHAGRRWEIVDYLQDVPLETVECAVDAALDDARSRLLSRRVDLDKVPPFALLLAHRNDGDSLCMSLSHVVGDGMSAYRLMRSIALAYAGIEDEAVGPDPLTVRDLSFYKHRWRVAEGVEQVYKVLKRRRDRSAEEPIARLANTGGDSHPSDGGFRGFCLLKLNRDETAAVITQRRPPATIGDVLIASLALAVTRWNDARALSRHPINVQTPVNLRPSEWFTGVVSNFATDVNIVVPTRVQDSLASAQRAVAEQTSAVRRQREAGELAVSTGLNLIPSPFRSGAVKRLQSRPNRSSTIVLSNLGAIDGFPELAREAGSVTELWFAPPGTTALGTLAGTLTLGGELFLALHYLKSEFSGAAARALVETWRDVLLGRASAGA